MSLLGGCFCGAIRYKVAGEPAHVTHCHCRHCRRTSAAAFVTWAEFPARGFAYTKGTPGEYRSRRAVTRTYCPKCGTQLTYRLEGGPETIDVTVCSLDAPEAIAPKDHVWADRRLPWVHLADGLPEFPRGRREGRG